MTERGHCSYVNACSPSRREPLPHKNATQRSSNVRFRARLSARPTTSNALPATDDALWLIGLVTNPEHGGASAIQIPSEASGLGLGSNPAFEPGLLA